MKCLKFQIIKNWPNNFICLIIKVRLILKKENNTLYDSKRLKEFIEYVGRVVDLHFNSLLQSIFHK